MSDERILLAHGSGGQLSHELVSRVFLGRFGNDTLNALGDSALLDLPNDGSRLALTTDSFVVSPLFFRGGSIGKLAICGTVNDLAVAGAKPLYLSAGFILEEGLPYEVLERVVDDMARMAAQSGVQIVTGDTKVVNHGAADGLFINTAGVGIVPLGRELSPQRLRVGDVLLINGTVGDHGIAVMLERENLGLRSELASDCAPLNGLIAEVLEACGDAVHCMRDATRGGLVATLNEWAESGACCLQVEETAIPVREDVRAACELLGLSPYYAANEGKVVIAVAPDAADAALRTIQAHELGRNAAIIGQVVEGKAGRVLLRTSLGARRLLDMIVGDQLPRIC